MTKQKKKFRKIIIMDKVRSIETLIYTLLFPFGINSFGFPRFSRSEREIGFSPEKLINTRKAKRITSVSVKARVSTSLQWRVHTAGSHGRNKTWYKPPTLSLLMHYGFRRTKLLIINHSDLLNVTSLPEYASNEQKGSRGRVIQLRMMNLRVSSRFLE